MHNLTDSPDHRDLADDLRARILNDWDLDQINVTIQAGDKEKALLKASGQCTKPDDILRWETNMEDNWLG